MHPSFDEERPLSLGLSNRDEAKAAESDREEAKHEIIMGSIWCALGLAITIAAAKLSHGNAYIIPWAFIAFGAIKLIRGLSNYQT